jgi:antiviral helicase SLH1
MEKKFRENAARPLFSGATVSVLITHTGLRKITAAQQAGPEILPHVYTSSSVLQGSVLSQLGSKYVLPAGTTRHDREVGLFEVGVPGSHISFRITRKLLSRQLNLSLHGRQSV